MKGIEKEVPQLVRLDPVRVRVEASEESGLFHVQAEQRTRAILTCSRCLSPFERILSGEWTQEFTDRADRADKERSALSREITLDLTPYIREAVLLELPYAPVCREDCKGLCPVCGVDRNRETCSCSTERIDPRLGRIEGTSNPRELTGLFTRSDADGTRGGDFCGGTFQKNVQNAEAQASHPFQTVGSRDGALSPVR